MQVGQTLTVRFAVHNVSKHPLKIALWVNDPAFVLRAADGTVYDSTALLANVAGIPPPIPQKLHPGATIHPSVDVVVRWRGPFQITPTCLGKPLPALHVSVATTWPGPDRSTAVAQVVAAGGHLLDDCRPQTSGVAVEGQIYPPSGTAPPLDAQCSVTIGPDGRFLVAQVLVLPPPGLAGVKIYQPYDLLLAERIGMKQSSSGTVSAFDWSGTGWQSGGSGSCGGTGYAWGGTGPYIAFISACPA